MKFEAIGTPKPDFVYYGERGDWLVTLGVHRDSDQVERSNWRYISERAIEQWPDDVAVEEMRHWAVGWIEYLLVRPDSEAAVKYMSDWQELLKIYPIADDDDYYTLVAMEANDG